MAERSGYLLPGLVKGLLAAIAAVTIALRPPPKRNRHAPPTPIAPASTRHASYGREVSKRTRRQRRSPGGRRTRRGFLQVWEYEFAWRATRQPQHTTGDGRVKEEAPDGGTFRGFFGSLGTAMGGTTIARPDYHLRDMRQPLAALPFRHVEPQTRPSDRMTGEGRVKKLCNHSGSGAAVFFP
jgi:hypothetical protein